jgi:hypothetical protein
VVERVDARAFISKQSVADAENQSFIITHQDLSFGFPDRLHVTFYQRIVLLLLT